jgi:hypothetical protein
MFQKHTHFDQIQNGSVAIKKNALFPLVMHEINNETDIKCICIFAGTEVKENVCIRD